MDTAELSVAGSHRFPPISEYTRILVGRASPHGVRVVQEQKDLAHSPHVHGIREGESEQDFWGPKEEEEVKLGMKE